MSLLSSLSSDGSLVAIINNNTTTNTNIVQRRKDGIQIALWSTITQTVQSTLYYNFNDNSNDDSPTNNDGDDNIDTNDYFIKVVIVTGGNSSSSNKNNKGLLSFVVAIYTRTIIVWDINRGILLHILNISSILHNSSKKKKKKQKSYSIVDAVQSISTSTSIANKITLLLVCNSSDDNDENGYKKLYMTECDLRSGNILLSTNNDGSSTNDTNSKVLWKAGTTALNVAHNTAAITYIPTTNSSMDSNILVLSNNDTNTDLSIRCVSCTDGSKIFKLSLLKKYNVTTSMIGHGFNIDQSIPKPITVSTDGDYCTIQYGSLITILSGVTTSINDKSNNDNKNKEWKFIKPMYESDQIHVADMVSSTLSTSVSSPLVQIRTISTIQSSLVSSLSKIVLLVNYNSSNRSILYEIQINHTTEEYTIQQQSDIHVHADIVQYYLFLSSSSSSITLSCIMSNMNNQYQFQSIPIGSTTGSTSIKAIRSGGSTSSITKQKQLQHNPKINIEWNDGTGTNRNNTKNTDKKRTSTNNDNQNRILGPGQQGNEVISMSEIDVITTYDDNNNSNKNDKKMKFSEHSKIEEEEEEERISRWKSIQETIVEVYTKEQEEIQTNIINQNDYIIENNLSNNSISLRKFVINFLQEINTKSCTYYEYNKKLNILLGIKNKSIIQSLFETIDNNNTNNNNNSDNNDSSSLVLTQVQQNILWDCFLQALQECINNNNNNNNNNGQYNYDNTNETNSSNGTSNTMSITVANKQQRIEHITVWIKFMMQYCSDDTDDDNNSNNDLNDDTSLLLLQSKRYQCQRLLSIVYETLQNSPNLLKLDGQLTL